jgi:hypothetical protein
MKGNPKPLAIPYIAPHARAIIKGNQKGLKRRKYGKSFFKGETI